MKNKMTILKQIFDLNFVHFSYDGMMDLTSICIFFPFRTTLYLVLKFSFHLILFPSLSYTLLLIFIVICPIWILLFTFPYETYITVLCWCYKSNAL